MDRLDTLVQAATQEQARQQARIAAMAERGRTRREAAKHQRGKLRWDPSMTERLRRLEEAHRLAEEERRRVGAGNL